MYGRSRSYKRSTSRRTSGTFGRRRSYAVKKVGRTVFKPRFATVGYTRNVEKKYFDKTYQADNLENETAGAGGPNVYNNGYSYISNTWGTYDFTGPSGTVAISNDMTKGVGTGADARSRIGNKIKVNYIKGSFTFTCAGTRAATTQGGEVTISSVVSDRLPYFRTTYRMVIVKDLQVNSTDTVIKWNQVFGSGVTGTALTAGVHSELNVDNMGRFIVLEDKTFTLTADTPQKTVPFTIKGSSVGNIRYNGSAGNALTDKGIYVIYAAFVMGVSSVLPADIVLPSPVGHSRLCFNDD
jgi:hypothetical protein